MAGDPVEGVVSSALGLHTMSTAPGADAPLNEITSMMPIFRPGSPWKQGAACTCTPEGRPYPFDVVGSKQPSGIDLYIGPPGVGKSLLMNSQNLALTLSAALVVRRSAALPYIRVADIGPSAKGLVDLGREALPRSLAHLATYIRFQNRPEFAYNFLARSSATAIRCRTSAPPPSIRSRSPARPKAGRPTS